MKKFMFVLMVLCMYGIVLAEDHVFGPYPNYKGTQTLDYSVTVPTTMDVYINNPSGGDPYHVAGRGGQEFNVYFDTPLFAHSYVAYNDPCEGTWNPKTDNLIITEIWTYDLQPALEPNQVPLTKAFEDLISAPYYEVIPSDTNGFVTGRSGTKYYAPVEMIGAESGTELADRLPGYDLTKIDFSSPGGGVWQVYVTQFTVPADEFIIEEPSPYFLVDSKDEWQSKLDVEWPNVHIRPLTQEEGDEYLFQLDQWWNPSDPNYGDPYGGISFFPAELYVWEPNESEPTNPDWPDDAGLVMTWGDNQTPDGERASAWAWNYGDPDLSNCIITVTASPPGPSGINRISLGMQDVNGNIRSWWWNVPSVIPYAPPGIPTTITIDTTLTGVGATNPAASGFANNAAFNITQVQNIVADENAVWVASQGSPPPGGTLKAIWNYWHNLSVTPKLPGGGANSKWYVKWSQPPVEISDGLIDGWDEVSMTQRLPNDPNTPIMADDWQCKDERPVTDIHWWGSFKGWTQPTLPPILPTAFHIGIWTNNPDPNSPSSQGFDPNHHDGVDWSHPLKLVWENTCTTSVWNFAGYDVDPRVGDPDHQENEACFQWAQFLSQDEWFHQHPMEDGTPNVYWVSIAAIYPANTDFTSPNFYPWGWKTRPHFFEDDAVRIIKTPDGTWPPVLGTTLDMHDCDPIHIGEVSWDLAFELTTNEPGYVDDPIPGDISGPAGVPDGSVNLIDLSVVAANWLTSVTVP